MFSHFPMRLLCLVWSHQLRQSPFVPDAFRWMVEFSITPYLQHVENKMHVPAQLAVGETVILLHPPLPPL